jgi:UrcA family protein
VSRVALLHRFQRDFGKPSDPISSPSGLPERADSIVRLPSMRSNERLNGRRTLGIGYLKGVLFMSFKTWVFDRALLPAAAVAAILTGVTESVRAEPPRGTAKAESVVATVSLADLDVSTPEGVRAANARLAKAAQRLCRKLGDTRRVSDSATYADCYRETLANALQRLSSEWR